MLDHDIKHNQPRRDAMQSDLDAYLDSGKMIEILTQPTGEPTSPLPKQPAYFNMRTA